MLAHQVDLIFLSKDLKIQKNILASFATTILLYGALIVLMAILRGLFLFLMRQTIIVMSRHIEFDQKNEIYNHFQNLPLSFYRKQNTGDLMARISEDVSRVRMYTGPAIMYGINLVTLFILVIGYMISVSPELTFYTLLPLPLLSLSIYYVNNIIEKRSEEIQKSLSRLSTLTQEAFSGIRVLKAFVREEDSFKRFSNESEQYRDQSLKLTFVNALFFPLMGGLIGLSTLLAIYAGGLEVGKGTLTTGTIAEFVIYVNMLTWPVTSLGWVISITQRSAASQARINEFLNMSSDIVSKTNLLTPIKGNLSFKNVSFTYPDSGIEAIKNLSFSVDAGQSLAIMGATGSGKSTIASLISRMYDPTKGVIEIDGQDIKNWDPMFLRSEMATVPQDVFLFSDTISNNIQFGAKEALSASKIEKAARQADLWDNIQVFPDKLETVVGERGITLSGGQKQRVSIARALVLNPKILVLDDCLSAVDTKTENAILNHLKAEMEGKTTVIISHRVSSAKMADTIIVLDGGSKVEIGTHEELLALNGLYADTYQRQLATEEV